MWLVAIVNMTNQAMAVGIPADTVSLRDERGREFTRNGDVLFLTEVGREYGVQQPYIIVQPGITEQVVMVFAVAPDAQTLTLASSNFQCRV